MPPLSKGSAVLRVNVLRSDCQQIIAHPSERNASWMSALARKKRLGSKSIIARCVLQKNEDGPDDHCSQSSQARDHVLIGRLLRLLAHPQLGRGGALLFPALLRHRRDVLCQPTFLDWPRPRPCGAIPPRETAARLARGHRGCCLSIILRLLLPRVWSRSYCPPGRPTAAQLSDRRGFVGVAGRVVGGFRPGDGFVDRGARGARRSLDRPSRARGCGRSRRRS